MTSDHEEPDDLDALLDEELQRPEFVRAYIRAQERAFSALHAQVRAVEAYHSPDEMGDCKGCEYGWPCRTVLLVGGGSTESTSDEGGR